MTLLWWFVWPKDRVTNRGGVRYWILRTAHSATWLFLGFAAVARMYAGDPASRAPHYLALAGLVCYGAFIVTFRVSPKASPAARDAQAR